ncbi:MAG: SAM-dependent methyltransferase [Burkholderiaceae bacterium]|nr:SAM-dependent methyltransferase [Burkholderiaceae bacterium]
MSTPLARLYLLPVPLGPEQDPFDVLPRQTLDAFARLEYFVVENAKAARGFLKPLTAPRPLQSLQIREWPADPTPQAIDELLRPLDAGHDLGLMSDAGCPAVADPGTQMVARAHERGFQVVPMTGPSSPVLALMASGLGGQRFAFVGYVPADPAGRVETLRALEGRSAEHDETILFIETPYRNQALLESMLETLAPDTRVFVGSELSLPSQRSLAAAVEHWRSLGEAALAYAPQRRPAIFGLRASTRSAASPGPRSAQPGRSPGRVHQRRQRRRR